MCGQLYTIQMRRSSSYAEMIKWHEVHPLKRIHLSKRMVAPRKRRGQAIDFSLPCTPENVGSYQAPPPSPSVITCQDTDTEDIETEVSFSVHSWNNDNLSSDAFEDKHERSEEIESSEETVDNVDDLQIQNGSSTKTFHIKISQLESKDSLDGNRIILNKQVYQNVLNKVESPSDVDQSQISNKDTKEDKSKNETRSQQYKETLCNTTNKPNNDKNVYHIINDELFMSKSTNILSATRLMNSSHTEEQSYISSKSGLAKNKCVGLDMDNFTPTHHLQGRIKFS